MCGTQSSGILHLWEDVISSSYAENDIIHIFLSWGQWVKGWGVALFSTAKSHLGPVPDPWIWTSLIFVLKLHSIYLKSGYMSRFCITKHAQSICNAWHLRHVLGKIYTTIGWISVKCSTDIHCPQRMNMNCFEATLTFPQTPQWGPEFPFVSHFCPWLEMRRNVLWIAAILRGWTLMNFTFGPTSGKQSPLLIEILSCFLACDEHYCLTFQALLHWPP